MSNFIRRGALLAVLMVMASVAAFADDMRGDQFVTAMDGNTLSGATVSGLAFNLYFLAGVSATYTDSGGAKVYDTWKIDRKGDICVHWPSHIDAMEGCFRVLFHGHSIAWRGGDGGGRGRLRGGVADSFMKPAQ